ncbi:hypothetical protein E2562_038755 [Oryza meyeriana var. granulata]|uniref:Uncharacterized protein n=1 Tax=Oryza meyeriana var. granulata TaxID=110450 RepID=A0A6G1BR03_9ORYZ|nr:hypothetical protein E2562_038755 [Oryza meyeriana var. granulata]
MAVRWGGPGSRRWKGRQRQGWSPPLGLVGSNPEGPRRPAFLEELYNLSATAGLDATFFTPASMPPRQLLATGLNASCLLSLACSVSPSTSSSPAHGRLAP